MITEYSCSGCAFEVRSESEDEVITLVREHADEMHDMSMSEVDVREGWREVQTETDD